MALSVGASSTATFSGTNTGNVTLVASVATNDIVLLFVSNEKNGANQTVTGVTSSPVLTWSRLLTALQWNQTVGGTAENNAEVWWAPSSGSIGASTLVVTPTLSAATDDAAISVRTVTGADTVTPLDSGGAVSATNTTSTVSAVTVSGFSTTATNTVAFGYFSSSGNIRPSAGAGWTQDCTFTNGGGINFESQFIQYQIFSSSQSGITVPTTGSSASDWGWQAFAIKASSGPPTINLAASFAMGFTVTATLQDSIPLSAVTMQLGFVEYIRMPMELPLLPFSFAVGFNESQSFLTKQISPAVSPAQGLSMTVTLTPAAQIITLAVPTVNMGFTETVNGLLNGAKPHPMPVVNVA